MTGRRHVTAPDGLPLCAARADGSGRAVAMTQDELVNQLAAILILLDQDVMSGDMERARDRLYDGLFGTGTQPGSSVAIRPGRDTASYADAIRRVLTAGATSAIWLLAAERARQADGESYTPEHDAGHVHGELARAGAAYALMTLADPDFSVSGPYVRGIWPAGWGTVRIGSPIRMLAKAGALIAAEIDRRLARGERP